LIHPGTHGGSDRALVAVIDTGEPARFSGCPGDIQAAGEEPTRLDNSEYQ
jgi:hypothetical protein